MAYIMACGERIDKDRSETFGDQLEAIYRNPFQKQSQRLETAQDIKDYVVKIFSE